jgi:hypothetical protein
MEEFSMAEKDELPSDSLRRSDKFSNFDGLFSMCIRHIS